MALIKCPECGKEFSDTSWNCVHCGYAYKSVLIKTNLNVFYDSTYHFLKASFKKSEIFIKLSFSFLVCIFAFYIIVLVVAKADERSRRVIKQRDLKEAYLKYHKEMPRLSEFLSSSKGSEFDKFLKEWGNPRFFNITNEKTYFYYWRKFDEVIVITNPQKETTQDSAEIWKPYNKVGLWVRLCFVGKKLVSYDFQEPTLQYRRPYEDYERISKYTNNIVHPNTQ